MKSARNWNTVLDQNVFIFVGGPNPWFGGQLRNATRSEGLTKDGQTLEDFLGPEKYNQLVSYLDDWIRASYSESHVDAFKQEANASLGREDCATRALYETTEEDEEEDEEEFQPKIEHYLIEQAKIIAAHGSELEEESDEEFEQALADFAAAMKAKKARAKSAAAQAGTSTGKGKGKAPVIVVDEDMDDQEEDEEEETTTTRSLSGQAGPSGSSHL